MTDTPWIRNTELAKRTLAQLQARGVRTVVLCPGGRNAPWVDLLMDPASDFRFEVISHFDERAASFFALGRARATLRPVAVVVTSGSAVGELLPAAMEARHIGASLLFLTADRPRRFRGTGAPQSCEQVGIFGGYADSTLDLDGASGGALLKLEEGGILPPGASHWNVCFEEPQNESIPPGEPTPFEASRFPLVVVGELHPDESRGVATVLRQWGYPVVLEALSQLREDPSLEEIRIHPHRSIWNEARTAGYAIDSVIRVGGMPAHRLWRDLEVHPEASSIPVVSIGALPFSGLPRARTWQMNLRDLYRLAPPVPGFVGTGNEGLRQWKASNAALFTKLPQLLQELPESEPGVFHQLSRAIPPGAQVYLGNSLPIREWDLAAATTREFCGRRICASRGLNGIDGQLSTFFGMLEKDRENWAILGDLTTLYDLNAPWVIQLLQDRLPEWRLVIINNSGGRIFERLFGKPAYLNEHHLRFGDWASQWKLTHERIEGAALSERLARGGLPRILEIVPDAAATSKFWNEWEAG